MEVETSTKIIDELDNLLDVERDILLRGDLDGLSRLLQRKEALIDELNALETLSRESLVPVRSKVQRNQALLDGALQGIRLVASRLAALRREQGPIETYTQSGRKTALGGATTGHLEKRA